MFDPKARGQFDPIELVENSLARIVAEDADLNIFVHLDSDGARAAAKASDARLRAGKALSPIDGIPIAVKANIAVEGMPLHAGVGIYRDRRAIEDAACVASLRRAGAVIIGIVNMHEGAFGVTTDNPWFGRTRNPIDRNRTAGGSSGGSAAAVAAGFVPFALGSDTAGSSRIPAAFTGTVGLKPGRDSIDSRGLMPMAPDLDVVGLHANSVAATRAFFDQMASRSRVTASGVARRDMVVGLPRFREACVLDLDVIAAVDAMAARAMEAGARVTMIDIDLDLEELVRAVALICADCMAASYPDLVEAKAGLSDEFLARLSLAGQLPREHFATARDQVRIADGVLRASMQDFDALLLPTTPFPATRFSEPLSGVAAYTVAANLTGLPALALPVDPGNGRLPVSVQLMGWREKDIFDLGAAIEHAT